MGRKAPVSMISFPGFLSRITSAVFQLYGVLSDPRMLLNSFKNISGHALISFFIMSGEMPSGLGARFPPSYLAAFKISV